MELGDQVREKLLADQKEDEPTEEETSAVRLHALKLEYWKEFCNEESPHILDDDGLCIAKDGGVSDIDELLYPMQYFYAGLLIAFCLANIYMISLADLTAILVEADAETAAASRKFLLSKVIIEGLLGTSHSLPLDKVIPLMELLYLVCLMVQIVYRIVCVAVSMKKETLQHSDARCLAQWHCVSDICWTLVPQLSSFSAMRLLYYVTPSVVGTQAMMQVAMFRLSMEAAHTKTHKFRAIWALLRYVLVLGFCLIVGLDSFLVKYRMAAGFIDRRDCTAENMLGTFIFLFQVLGIVNLNWFVRERLFIFIFGGEDGSVDQKEMARWHVWNALLAKRIWERFGVFHGTVVMLGFDDYDFQLLVLDDEGKDTKMELKRKGLHVEAAFARTLVADGENRLSPSLQRLSNKPPSNGFHLPGNGTRKVAANSSAWLEFHAEKFEP